MFKASPPIFPQTVRRTVLALSAVLLVVAIAAILIRGEAILIDLSGLARAVWCF